MSEIRAGRIGLDEEPETVFIGALDVVRDNSGGVRVNSRSGGKPVQPTRIYPHSNTDRLVEGRDAVGHTEYFRDGTAKFSFKDGRATEKQAQRDGVTGHAKAYQTTTGRALQHGDNKMITGHSYKGGKMRFGSNTHNTGASPHCESDRYTRDGSREATAAEQGMTRDMVGAWRRDGQPTDGWWYDPRTGKAGGRNANRRN